MKPAKGSNHLYPKKIMSNSNNHFFRAKRVLVTGGAGFIGTNLILQLLKKGAKVRATIHQKAPQIRNSKVEFVKADLTKTSDCEKVVEEVDYVFMCAANTQGAAVIEKTPLAHVTPNVIMNSLMLEAAHKAGVKKFLFISSNTVYPLTDFPVRENDVNYSIYEKYFPVGWMKLFTEKMCEMYATKIKNPMLTIVVRPGNVYGPFDDFNWESSHVIPALIRKVIERHTPLEVWGDGRDVKDFIFVEDLVEGLILAMEKIEKFDQINIGGGKPVTIRKVLKAILKADKYKNAKVVFNSLKPTMIPIRLINISKAKKILGFTPKTLLEQGLQKTVKWYKQNETFN
ncbi:NAD(P)-dependent oxidoreductase [Candidatus Daviesbacteria bacterium]|nr:NAD(P)-dependent oxidoreductase [Candidatus Daviesbacteria bacterium]